MKKRLFFLESLPRLFDILFALFFLVLLAPLFLLIIILIKVESKGPAIFKQKRVGKDLVPYDMYKFRSMYLHNYSPEELGPIKHNHALVTPLGFLLRRFKLDELPQFINVVRGEMGIVGPRPCLYSSSDTMSWHQKRRFRVLPGLTGWAEVNGNVELSWEEQLLLDLWYVDHKSFSLDCKIIWRTILIMLFGSSKNHSALQMATLYLQNDKSKPLVR